MSVIDAQQKITQAVLRWEGITAEPHHLRQDTGWVSFYLRQSEDIERAIALLQRSYKLAITQRHRRNQSSDSQ